MKKKGPKIRTFDSLIEEKYGPPGTPERDEWERGYQAFKLGVMIAETRKEKKMTQEQVAQKCGTSKSYISRIENDASDIRLSTLQRIIHEGLGRELVLEIRPIGKK